MKIRSAGAPSSRGHMPYDCMLFCILRVGVYLGADGKPRQPRRHRKLHCRPAAHLSRKKVCTNRVKKKKIAGKTFSSFAHRRAVMARNLRQGVSLGNVHCRSHAMKPSLKELKTGGNSTQNGRMTEMIGKTGGEGGSVFFLNGFWHYSGESEAAAFAAISSFARVATNLAATLAVRRQHQRRS